MQRCYKNLLVICFVLFFNCLYGQSDQEKFLVAGKVLNSKTGESVSLAHVILEGKRKVTACDEWGMYRVLLTPGDSITVTAIGYKPTKFILSDTVDRDTYKEILLQPTSYRLEEVTVMNLGTWEQFRQDFIHMKLEPTKKEKIIINMNKSIAANIKMKLGAYNPTKATLDRLSAPKGIVSTVGLSSGVGFGNRKDFKSILKIKSLTKEYKYAKILTAKYNRDIVADITGEKSKERLDKLMAYINKNAHFTYATKEMDILKEVKDLYSKFIILNPTESNKFEQDTV